MEYSDITFRTRKWVRPEDLNANGTLFGGSLLKWIDEEAAISMPSSSSAMAGR